MIPPTTPPSRSAPGARDQVERLLALVPWLHGRDEVHVEEAAERLGVPPTQLVRDLKVLLMCGLPGGYPDDLIDVDLDALEGPDAEGVIRVSNADYLSRPLRLTPTEATALIVALRAVRGGAGEETAEVVDRTLAKLEVAAAGAVAEVPQVEVAEEPSVVPSPWRSDLADAVSRGRQVRLTYYVPARDEESERLVDPWGLVDAEGHTYLDAWCHRAEAPRLFRLDRIHEAAVLDTRVDPGVRSPRDPSEDLLQLGPDAVPVRLRLEPPAFWVTEYYPVTGVREVEGHLEADLRVADPRWVRRLLLRLAPHARVLAPADVAADLAAEVDRALDLYG